MLRKFTAQTEQDVLTFLFRLNTVSGYEVLTVRPGASSVVRLPSFLFTELPVALHDDLEKENSANFEIKNHKKSL